MSEVFSQEMKHGPGWNREICVLLKLDKQGSERVNQYYTRLEELGYPPAEVHGHITLAHFHGIHPDELIGWTREFLSDKQAFSVEFEELGRLGRCLVFLAAESPVIKRWFHEFHERFDALSDPFTSREGGMYTAHTSLSCRTDIQVDEQGVEKLRQRFKPFRARVARVEVSEILADNYRILESFDLE